MTKVYLINVGANTAHSQVARSPIFSDSSFRYVSFPRQGERRDRPYPRDVHGFVRDVDRWRTHFDPDWDNKTYGDSCSNGRAGALKRARPGDVLLFWSLLWRNTGQRWEDFTGERGWYFIGALRKQETLADGQSAAAARGADARQRAEQNAHFVNGKLKPGDRVFIGSPSYSTLFQTAVDLEATRKSGLLFRTIRTADGQCLELSGKRDWRGAIRSCRAIWDLDKAQEFKRAKIASAAILGQADYDIFQDM
jgi:putative DNA base modification enzyme with NMAD domain